MMGVYIKDFKIPKDCPMCPLAHYNKLDEFTGCEITSGKRYVVKYDDQYASSTTRPQWCPLIEVSGCGRLIDADALYKELSTVDDDTTVTVVPGCESGQRKPVTNGDKIRSMSDKELSLWLDNMKITGCPTGEVNTSWCDDFACSDCWLLWLKQEATT